jgi:hypothetical protein
MGLPPRQSSPERCVSPDVPNPGATKPGDADDNEVDGARGPLEGVAGITPLEFVDID